MLTALKVPTSTRSCICLNRFCEFQRRTRSTKVKETATNASPFQTFISTEKEKFLTGKNYSYLSSPYKSTNHLREIDAVSNLTNLKHDFKLEPVTRTEKIAKSIVNGWVVIVDKISGFHKSEKTKQIWLSKLVLTEMFLANAPLVGSMVYHTKAVLNPGRDMGTVSRYLTHADNLRHSFVALLEIKNPNLFYRLATTLVQLIDMAYWAVAMFPAPRWNHRMVAYMLEDSVQVLNECLDEISTPNSCLFEWNNEQAPQFAVDYWALKEGNTSIKDMLIAIREDMLKHLVANHVIASISRKEMRPLRN
ncbi:uncharacterized protein LOC142348669 [Convolutriloba macropyga]|uniref:uncharacterized protein LOC142348669 n=1 Tax=Convolutriloba macropyga TaxID=536237 RepID=UPI003F526E06